MEALQSMHQIFIFAYTYRPIQRSAPAAALDYASALVEGPTPALLAKLGPEADNYLEVVAAHPLKSTTFKVS